ncbi:MULTISPECIES: DUF2842 domain-containing protein [unclassified Beijerinckia]|uniref:DUF2842 domain-containing protein n=1 Tax=unclassified Beijerinckia TaxID=2638183 RepID=UPI00089C84D3|nr:MULTISPECIES: DUF2842 domain-containing protein [unclassified Beijerinckia]MDH7794775.1 DNA-binding transcriptional regulator of glucitol operon [Beijerinckia sp. GAS462]SEB74735.1 Protein of unknown function [Beijerinckia sp. 28-YEA-48]
MKRRTRKLIGAAVVLAFVVVYALLVMALAQARIFQEANAVLRGFGYAFLGIGWIIPMFPFIKWMEGGGDSKS